MVAAWMSADTGVGPAIASPSQDCSGNCADLPHAASSSISPIAVSVPSDARPPRRRARSRSPALPNVREQQPHRDQQPDVTDAVGDERLLRGDRVRRVVVPEPDEQVRRETHALPADEQQHVRVREDQQQHRRDEQVEVREEPAAGRRRAPCTPRSTRGSGCRRTSPAARTSATAGRRRSPASMLSAPASSQVPRSTSWTRSSAGRSEQADEQDAAARRRRTPPRPSTPSQWPHRSARRPSSSSIAADGERQRRRAAARRRCRRRRSRPRGDAVGGQRRRDGRGASREIRVCTSQPLSSSAG